MRTRLAHLWESLSASYWFLPSLMTLLGAAAALTLVNLDRASGEKGIGGWTYGGGAQGARALLAAVAGSVITVAGVVFSITIGTLTQASSQFGPRVLRNFMRDRGNQIVLGTFVSTFAYCLLVLRTVRGENGNATGEFVPNLSVTVAVFLAAASIGVLIYFVHHVSESIQAPVLVAAIYRDLEQSIDRLFPQRIGRGGLPAPTPLVPENFDRDAAPVHANRSGYLQAIDDDGLLHAARDADLLVRIEARPGRFVIDHQPLLLALPADHLDDDVRHALRSAFIVGAQRTREQDVEFAIHQLVEVAVRSLSPGINDPFTAVNCIDWLAAGLCRLAGRQIPSPYRCDENDKLRVIAAGNDFAQVLDAAFHQIRQHARRSAGVTIHLLDAFSRIARCAQTPEQREALRRHALLVHDSDPDTFRQPPDRHALDARFTALISALNEPS